MLRIARTVKIFIKMTQRNQFEIFYNNSEPNNVFSQNDLESKTKKIMNSLAGD